MRWWKYQQYNSWKFCRIYLRKNIVPSSIIAFTSKITRITESPTKKKKKKKNIPSSWAKVNSFLDIFLSFRSCYFVKHHTTVLRRPSFCQENKKQWLQITCIFKSVFIILANVQLAIIFGVYWYSKKDRFGFVFTDLWTVSFDVFQIIYRLITVS